MHVLLHSLPPTLQQATTDPPLCWRLPGKSGSVSCGVTAPFSWVLVNTRFCLCPPRVYFPILCKFWQLCGGVNGNLLQEGFAILKSAAPRAPVPVAVHCWPVPPQETLKHSSVSASVESLGPGAHKVCLSPLTSPVGMGFNSKGEFAPLIVLLGLPLCPWAWGISSQPLQWSTAAALAPTILLGFLWAWTWDISSWLLQCYAATAPAVKRREAKSKGGKERYTPLDAEFQRIARRDKKAFLSDQCKEIDESNRMRKIRDLFKKIRDTMGTFHAKMGTIKDRNGMDLTEAEDIKKRWQEYTEELYKKDLHDPDNHDAVITLLEPDILEYEVKWALESITTNKASRGDGIPVEVFQILKDDAVKVLHSICQQIWKTQQWPQDWKRSVFIPIPKKGSAKEFSNYRTIALISC